ncbi:hypothetical protein ACIBI4_22460 [Streptomyces sp. NPDC050418]|uniref:hypothetical protein n=1 Tax=Streptomyces sp. NPDC050418 TaxID=3365612 RepID=UPI003796B887
MNVTEETMRSAELTARAGLEPELAVRLGREKGDVLREFGLTIETAALIPAGGEGAFESLSSGAGAGDAAWCVCFSPEVAVPGFRA